MFDLLLSLGILYAIYGLITGEITLGVSFVISAAVTLYSIIYVILNKTRQFTDFGAFIVTIAIIWAICTGCDLFLDIRVFDILGIPVWR